MSSNCSQQREFILKKRIQSFKLGCMFADWLHTTWPAASWQAIRGLVCVPAERADAAQVWDDLELRPAVVWKAVAAAAAGQRAVTSHCFEINPSALEEASLICGLRALSGASSIYCVLVVPRRCAACYFLCAAPPFISEIYWPMGFQMFFVSFSFCRASALWVRAFPLSRVLRAGGNASQRHWVSWGYQFDSSSFRTCSEKKRDRVGFS